MGEIVCVFCSFSYVFHSLPDYVIGDRADFFIERRAVEKTPRRTGRDGTKLNSPNVLRED